MAIVKFKQGTRTQLDSTNIDNGTVYFIPDSNNGNGDIAFDWENERSWIMNPKVISVSDLDNSIPKIGELIVVADALTTIDDTTKQVTAIPGLKIGDGITTISLLPYLNDYYRVTADILSTHITDLTNHIANTNIHHTINGKIDENNSHMLHILNYDSN